MRASLWIALACTIAGCKGEPFTPDAKIDAPLDAYQAPWWTPKKNEYSNWDIQLVAPFDTSAARAMYVLDLWAVTPARTIDYGDGTPVDVPAGPLAGVIETLHGTTPPTKVVCSVRAGSVRLATDPDASKFPGYDANPPNDPTAPAAGSVIGWSVRSGHPDERYLDVRAEAQSIVQPLIRKRLEVAAAAGCDGVLMDRNDRYQVELTGWGEPSFEDERAWHLAVMRDAHEARMAAGTKNSHLRALADVLAAEDSYDFTVVERCAEFEECQFVRPYLNLMKPVFDIEIPFDAEADEGLDFANACQRLANEGVEDGIMKTRPFAGNGVMTCP